MAQATNQVGATASFNANGQIPMGTARSGILYLGAFMKFVLKLN